MSDHSNEQIKTNKEVASNEVDDQDTTSEHATLKKVEETNEQNDTKGKKINLNFRTRKFPMWLRMIVVLILLIMSLLLGLIVGYAVFGDGDVIDALKIDTYQHILDIINKEK